MPGPVSDSYEGPSDDKPILPSWAFDPPPEPAQGAFAPVIMYAEIDGPSRTIRTRDDLAAFHRLAPEQQRAWILGRGRLDGTAEPLVVLADR